MSYETGTATDHVDLFNKLRTFLTTAVGSGGAGWSENRFNGTNIMELRAPGLADTEEINVAIRYNADGGTDAYSLDFRMSPDWQSAFTWAAQTNQSAGVYHPLWNTTMPYWFIGNKHRVIVVTKVSTVYSASYIGRFLPYGTPQEYGLPWFLGGCLGDNTRWSSVSENHRAFFDPRYAYLYDAAGTWRFVGNHYDETGSEGIYTGNNYVWPYSLAITSSSARSRWRELRDNVDGTYPLFPLVLAGEDPSYEIYGELDGAFAIPAFSAASEDTITIGADTYLVVQTSFHTSRWNYCAIKLA